MKRVERHSPRRSRRAHRRKPYVSLDVGGGVLPDESVKPRERGWRSFAPWTRASEADAARSDRPQGQDVKIHGFSR